MKRIAQFGLGAALAAIAATAPASAKVLEPIRAQTVDLGEARGVAYYTVDKGHYHVVVTVSSETAQPVRFESDLAPNQSVTVSAPQKLGVEARSLLIRRVGDKVLVGSEEETALRN